MTIKDILLANLSKAVPDSLYQPTDELLDEIWAHAVSEALQSKGIDLLMSDVVNSDAVVERLQIDLAATGSLESVIGLRERLQELFRTWAYNLAERYESEVMDAYRAAPSCMRGE